MKSYTGAIAVGILYFSKKVIHISSTEAFIYRNKAFGYTTGTCSYKIK